MRRALKALPTPRGGVQFGEGNPRTASRVAPEIASSFCDIIRSNRQHRFGRHFQGAFSGELTQG